MKKITTAIAVAALGAFLAVACGGQSTPAPVTPNPCGEAAPASDAVNPCGGGDMGGGTYGGAAYGAAAYGG